MVATYNFGSVYTELITSTLIVQMTQCIHTIWSLFQPS